MGVLSSSSSPVPVLPNMTITRNGVLSYFANGNDNIPLSSMRQRDSTGGRGIEKIEKKSIIFVLKSIFDPKIEKKIDFLAKKIEKKSKKSSFWPHRRHLDLIAPPSTPLYKLYIYCIYSTLYTPPHRSPAGRHHPWERTKGSCLGGAKKIPKIFQNVFFILMRIRFYMT